MRVNKIFFSSLNRSKTADEIYANADYTNNSHKQYTIFLTHG